MRLQTIVSLAVCSLLSLMAAAQDRVYYKNGDIVEFKVTELARKSLKGTPSKPGDKNAVNRSGVLFAFNSKGNFLVIPKLNEDQKKGQTLVTDFLQGQSNAFNIADRILTTGHEIITANYDAEDENNITYSIKDKKNVIPKAQVALVIFKNGEHRLYVDANKAFEVLRFLEETYGKLAFHSGKLEGFTVASQTPVKDTGGIVRPENHTRPLTDSVAAKTTSSTAGRRPDSTTTSRSTKSNDSAFTKDQVQQIDSLGEVSYNEYSDKALRKTEDLSEYLKIICNKGSEIDDVNKATEGALELFVNEQAIVEVSSTVRDQVKQFTIRSYLNLLKRLNYEKVEIEWMNIQYVSKLRKGPDGNYYGVITFEQKFSGLIGDNTVYSDITRKNVEVILKTYSKSVEGKTVLKWDVLLSDIGVVVTKSS